MHALLMWFKLRLRASAAAWWSLPLPNMVSTRTVAEAKATFELSQDELRALSSIQEPVRVWAKGKDQEYLFLRWDPDARGPVLTVHGLGGHGYVDDGGREWRVRVHFCRKACCGTKVDPRLEPYLFHGVPLGLATEPLHQVSRGEGEGSRASGDHAGHCQDGELASAADGLAPASPVPDPLRPVAADPPSLPPLAAAPDALSLPASNLEGEIYTPDLFSPVTPEAPAGTSSLEDGRVAPAVAVESLFLDSDADILVAPAPNAAPAADAAKGASQPCPSPAILRRCALRALLEQEVQKWRDSGFYLPLLAMVAHCFERRQMLYLFVGDEVGQRKL